MKSSIRLAAMTAASLLYVSQSRAQVLYTENFNDAAAAGRWTAKTSGITTTVSNFAFDYSSVGIPSAPRGTATVGVALDANTVEGTFDGLSVYPNGQNFSGDFSLKFDVYMLIVGTSGTTEEMIGGINASGTKVNHENSGSSDGIFFANTGEGGRSQDVHRYIGNPAGPANITNVAYAEGFQNLPQVTFPDPINEDGSPSNQWQTVEISQVNDVVRFKVNGALYNEYDNTGGAFTAGNILLGYQDNFGSVNASTFGIFDNVVVRQISRWSFNGNDVWTNAARWNNATVPNGLDAVAAIDSSFASPGTITLNSGITLGSLVLRNTNAINIAGTGTITMDTNGDRPSIGAGLGAHAIRTAMTYNKGVVFNIGADPSDTSSSLLLTGSQTFAAGSRVIKTGGGELIIPRVFIPSGGDLSIGAGTVTLGQGLSNNTPSNVTRVGTLRIVNPDGLFYDNVINIMGTLDITNNTVAWDYSAGNADVQKITLATLTAGYASGAWTGTGLRSSTAAAASATSTKTGIGYAYATELNTGTFNGQSLDGDAIVYAYTLQGDSNLDFKVNTLDFNNLAGAFGTLTTGTWFQGDFNYDGNVDSTDFDAFAANYGKTLPASGPTLGSVVPEPATLGLLAMVPIAMLRRRR